jgi:hypothetical protein
VVFNESSFPYPLMTSSQDSTTSCSSTQVSIPFFLPPLHSQLGQVTSQQHLPSPVHQVQQDNMQQHSTHVTINDHPMVTRGKNGIFKKRAYHASTSTTDPATT